MADFANLSILEIIKLLAPLLIIEVGLKLFCIYSIVKHGVRNASKLIWTLIVVFVTLGSVIFLLAGKRRY